MGWGCRFSWSYYCDVIIGQMASQITSLTIVYSTVHSGADQRKHQSSTSLAFVRGIHRWPVHSQHKWPGTLKMFPFDDVIMSSKTLMSINTYERIRCCLSRIQMAGNHHWTWTLCLSSEQILYLNRFEPWHEHSYFIGTSLNNGLASATLLTINKTSNFTYRRYHNWITVPQQIMDYVLLPLEGKLVTIFMIQIEMFIIKTS